MIALFQSIFTTAAFEAAGHAFLDALFDGAALSDLVARLAPHGRSDSLAQKLLQLAGPGSLPPQIAQPLVNAPQAPAAAPPTAAAWRTPASRSAAPRSWPARPPRS